jgi:alkylation response protein AidB-like acyl-CoA dehydrogenase
VPAEDRIDEGGGLDVAHSSSTLYGRLNLTAVALGVHQAILDDTVAFCHAPELYGEPLAKPPTIAQKPGDMHSRLMTARLAAYNAVHQLDSGAECDAELMNAKLVNTESALTSARAALEIFAGRGCQTDHDIERATCSTRSRRPAPARCSGCGSPRSRSAPIAGRGRAGSPPPRIGPRVRSKTPLHLFLPVPP